MDPTHALLRDVRGFKCDVFVQFMKEKGELFFKLFLIKNKSDKAANQKHQQQRECYVNYFSESATESP